MVYHLLLIPGANHFDNKLRERVARAANACGFSDTMELSAANVQMACAWQCTLVSQSPSEDVMGEKRQAFKTALQAERIFDFSFLLLDISTSEIWSGFSFTN